MSTAYSSEVSVGTYNRLRLRVEYSGTSAHCYMEFRRTSSYTGTWADTQASITLNGTTKSAPYSYSGTVGTDWVQLCNADGFTISTSGGTYNWTFNNPGGSSVLGCSGSITLSAQGTAPTGLSLSNVTPGTNQIAATVSVTGWGGLGDANTRFREMSVWAYGGESTGKRRIQKATGNTLSSTITVTNSSEVIGSLTITPNTKYTLTTFASNGTMYTDQTNVTNTATKATAPTVSVSAYTSTTVTIAYSTSADGGAYTKYIDYSLDGTNWTNGATVSSSSATSGTFTITGLSPKTAYSIRTRVRTTAGNTTGQTLSATTKAAMYGSVSNKTKLVKKFYGSANALGNPPLKGNTTQSASPTPPSPQVVNVATGGQSAIVAGKNLSPSLSSYLISSYGADSVTKSGDTVTVAISTSGKGIYFGRNLSQNALICPQMWVSGYTVSFTISASVPGKVSIGFEQGTIPTYDLTSTPIRVSFTTVVNKNWHIYQSGSGSVTFTISDLQVEAGSTATTFSTYATLCPINLGKNLFNPAQAPIHLNGPATVSQITNGLRITSNRTSTSTTSHYDAAFFAVVRADEYIGKALSLSVGTASPSTSGNQRMTIITCDADGSNRTTKQSTTGTSNARITYTPTDEDRGKYIAVGLYAINGVVSPAGSYVDYKNIQFEVGSTNTAYAAYFTPIELCKIDTHQDYIHKSGDDWYIHKEIGKRIFDGSENWTFSSTSVYPYRIVISDIDMGISNQGVAPKVLTNLYTPKKWNYDTSTEVLPAYCVTATPNSTTLCFRNTDAATLADFKTELTSNNLVTYYLLATPTETQITNSTLISQLNALWSATTYGDDTNLTIGAVDLQAIGTDIFRSTRRIEKFYGSVNGVTKLIYEE